MEAPTIIAIVVILIVILIATWYIKVLNKLNIALVKIDETSSGIDVALTKRYDLLTKMIEVVKGYTKHEKDTLLEVTKSIEKIDGDIRLFKERNIFLPLIYLLLFHDYQAFRFN